MPNPGPFNSSNSPAGRFIGFIFCLAFFGIGLTVLGFLWLTPFDEFGSPPLFFRIFGSFIAIVFVAVGGAGAWGAIFGKGNPLDPNPDSRLNRARFIRQTIPAAESAPLASPALSIPDGYLCPHCGAPLQSNTEISPLGDVKCPFCHAWFNIHQTRIS
jgi:hypothetical protein